MDVSREAAAVELLDAGFVVLEGAAPSSAAAWAAARATCEAATGHDALGRGLPPLEVVGEFALPPPRVPQRDFQALHIDFGLPVAPDRPADVARFTALHVEHAATAQTRIVPLRRLLGARAWDPVERIVERLAAHGRGGSGAAEGILARLVEVADGTPTLPSPGDGFLCGTEFSSVAEERVHLAARGLDVAACEERVRLRAGDLLVFDNLATAHGRSGTRAPLELHQLCLGYRGLSPGDQSLLLERVLSAFAGTASQRTRQPAGASIRRATSASAAAGVEATTVNTARPSGPP
jgi:hypothetical protein